MAPTPEREEADNGRIGRAARWLFEDRRTGKIVVGQTPNLPLIVFLCAFAIDLVFKPHGLGATLVRAVKGISLTVWAGDELIRGVNPFRRIGGAAVLAYIAWDLAWAYLLG